MPVTAKAICNPDIDGVVGQLPERFESRFKTVQREQIKSDDIVLATDINYSRTKVFLSSMT